MLKILATLCLIALTGCVAPSPADPGQPIPQPSPVKPAQPQTATPTPKPVVAGDGSVDALKQIAVSSECAKFDFEQQGRPRKSWLRGIAVVYARAICSPDREEVKLLKQPPGSNDALAWYGIKDEPLRATYALMVGLAARESSWRYCCGRDMGADFDSASSAEAGFLQTSYGARVGAGGVLRAGGAIDRIYRAWRDGDRSKCLLDVFASDLPDCGSTNAKNWGDGDGASWQKLSKTCPAFAAEYGALVMRFNGGQVGEFGPIRHKNAQYVPACAEMFGQIESFVRSHPQVCQQL